MTPDGLLRLAIDAIEAVTGEVLQFADDDALLKLQGSAYQLAGLASSERRERAKRAKRKNAAKAV